MKKLIGMTLAFIFALTLAACGGANDTTEAEATTYLSVDINPGVEFVLDDEGDVESVLPLNEDAETVLADLDLEGQPSDEALEAFIDAAVETGYIDVDSDENVVTVTSDDEEEEEAKKAEVEGILEERAIGAAVFGGEMNEEYEELAEEHDISAGRARLISRAVEFSDDLETFEDGLELDHSEIMTILIDEHRAQMDEFIENRQPEAKEMKDDMKEMAQEKVEAHRSDVDSGDKSAPDLDKIREDVEADLDNIRSQFEDRVKERRENAEDYVPEDATSYLSVDINPGIEFVLDDEGDVESVVPLNEDAEVVISDLDLEGKPSDEALEAFIDAAVDTGYLDVDSDENVVTVTSDDEEEEEAKKAEVEGILEDRAIGAAVFGGEMNEEYEELAEEHDIDVGRARLISRAVEFSDDLTFEDALEMDHSEIMTILVDEHRAQMDEFIEDRQEAAKEMKDDMKEMAQEKVEAHRDAVEQGEANAPDFDSIQDDVEASMEDIRTQYEDKIQQKRQDAEDTN